MARGLQLWLEAAPGGAVPPECFAAVRPADGQAAGPPAKCWPQEASCLGGVGAGAGPVVVDIFQRVGSISLGAAEPGALVEATVAWPGLPELRLRLAAVALGREAEVPSGAPPSPPAADQQRPEAALEPARPQPPASGQAEAPELKKGAALKQLLLAPPAAGAEAAAQAPRPAACLQLAEEEPRKLYKPIALNDCHQIIPNLYLGGVAAVADPQVLVQQGIRAVCCCMRELEFPSGEFAKELEYYRVDVEDMAREPIELFFPEATEFIHSWTSREQPVLVHCRAGVSRSASVVIAYLIAYHGYSLHDAFFLVRSHRAIVTPNIGFMEKLGEYEEAKRATEPSIEINKYTSWYTTAERAAVPSLKPD